MALGQTNNDTTPARRRPKNDLDRCAAVADRYTDRYTIPLKIDANVAMIDSIIHRLRQTLHILGRRQPEKMPRQLPRQLLRLRLPRPGGDRQEEEDDDRGSLCRGIHYPSPALLYLYHFLPPSSSPALHPPARRGAQAHLMHVTSGYPPQHP